MVCKKVRSDRRLSSESYRPKFLTVLKGCSLNSVCCWRCSLAAAGRRVRRTGNCRCMNQAVSCTLHAYTADNAPQRDDSGHSVRHFDGDLSRRVLRNCRGSTGRSSLDSIHQVQRATKSDPLWILLIFQLSVNSFMAALRSRCGHHILQLWLLFSFSSFFLVISSPNLSGRRLDVYHTSSIHGLALVRI